MQMRRKTLAKEFDISLRTVDNILKLMRKSGKFDIIEGTVVLVDSDDFKWALRNRERLEEL